MRAWLPLLWVVGPVILVGLVAVPLHMVRSTQARKAAVEPVVGATVTESSAPASEAQDDEAEGARLTDAQLKALRAIHKRHPSPRHPPGEPSEQAISAGIQKDLRNPGKSYETIKIHARQLRDVMGVDGVSDAQWLLFYGVTEGRDRIVLDMIENGVNPDFKVTFSSLDTQTTPLIGAVNKNMYGMAQLLLENGADPDYSTAEFSPLGLARRLNSRRIETLLVDAGARHDIRTR